MLCHAAKECAQFLNGPLILAIGGHEHASGSFLAKEGSLTSCSRWRQWLIRTGTGVVASTVRVAPPSSNSRTRAWP